MFGAFEFGLDVLGGIGGPGAPVEPVQLDQIVLDAIKDMEVQNWLDAEVPPPTQLPPTILISLPPDLAGEGSRTSVPVGPFEVPLDQLPWWREHPETGVIIHEVQGRPVTQPTVDVPEEPHVTIDELVEGGGARDYPSGGVSGPQTATILQDLGLTGGNMGWLDDLADVVGAVGEVVTAPMGTQGSLLSNVLGIDPYQPQPVSYAPGGLWNGGSYTPARMDLPGGDIGRQGSISARGGPFFEGRTKLRTRRILQFTHPETGKIIWYRNMGRPILWSGDRSTVRRWNRNVGPARRVGASRKRKR